MTLRPYKFVVQAVVQQLDDDGEATGELEGQQVILFGCAALEKYAADFPKLLEAAQLP